MFADDTVIIYSAENIRTLEKMVNRDMQKYSEWLDSNKLVINEEKTVYIMFKNKTNSTNIHPNLFINGKKLTQVKKTKYLGLIIEETLKWNAHVDMIIDKLSPLVSKLRHLQPYLDDRTSKNIFYAYFHSVLGYLSVIWSNSAKFNLKRLQRLQNKIIKRLHHLPYEYPTKELYENYQYMKLDKLIKLQQCKLIYKLENNHMKSQNLLTKVQNVTNRETRQNNSYYLHRANTESRRRGPIYASLTTFNSMPGHIKNSLKCTFSNFKNLVISQL